MSQLYYTSGLTKSRILMVSCYSLPCAIASTIMKSVIRLCTLAEQNNDKATYLWYWNKYLHIITLISDTDKQHNEHTSILPHIFMQTLLFYFSSENSWMAMQLHGNLSCAHPNATSYNGRWRVPILRHSNKWIETFDASIVPPKHKRP